MSTPGNFPPAFPTRRLPQQPSLEQLRKQAKDLLEQYRAGDPSAVEEVNRFERHPDPATFALNDAQRVLARAYGYESWPKLKAFVDGANITRLAAAVQAGDIDEVRSLIRARPELVGMEMAGNNEHRAIHYAVLRRDAAMVRLLMDAGSDARKGIYPHRDATTAYALARDRDYTDIVAVIEEAEQRRRESVSCPNSTVSPIQDQINEAIHSGDNEHAQQMLEDDPSLIRACDRKGATPLHAAAESMNEEITSWLLARKANPNKRDLEGLTPLDRAALAASPYNHGAEHFPAIAQLLLHHGAELTIRSAVALGDQPRVRELVAENPAVLRDITWNRGGLLTLAVQHGRLETIRLLLDLGADVDERFMLHELEEPTESKGTPLWNAALLGDYEITKLLLDRGADPNANVYASGWPLRNSYQHKDGAITRLLIERGATPKPYMIAESNDVEEARRLLAANPGEDAIEELVWSAADHGNPTIVELGLPHIHLPRDDPRWNWFLIQPIRGVKNDGQDHERYFTAMSLLLGRVDPNVISRFGQTVLHFAAGCQGLSESDRARFVAMLLDHGARIDLRDEILRSTPLGWACRWGRREMAELLIARGAPVDEPDAEPWATPLAWATKMRHTKIVELLRRHTA